MVPDTVAARKADLRSAPLLDFWYRLSKEVMEHTARFPKTARFTVSSRVDNLMLDGLERLVQARYNCGKLQSLNEFNLILEKLRFFLRLAYDRKFLSEGCYEMLAKKLLEAGRMTGGWIRHLGNPYMKEFEQA